MSDDISSLARDLNTLISMGDRFIAGRAGARGGDGTATVTSYDRKRTVRALAPANWVAGEAIAFKDVNDNQWRIIPSSAGTLEDEKYDLLERHRPLKPNACKRLKPAIVYKILDEAEQSQDFWLVDFQGQHHHLIKVVAATEYYDDATYRYGYVLPGYDYDVYIISYNFIWNLTNDIITVTRAEIEKTNESGVEGTISGIGEAFYPAGQTTPPDISVGSVSIPEERTASRIIPGYFYALPIDPPEGYVRPATSEFSDAVGDEDDRFDWSEIWSSGTVPGVIGDDVVSEAINLMPWLFHGRFYFTGRTNPDGDWRYFDLDGDGQYEELRGNAFGAYRYVTQWHAELEAWTEPGQSRTPPEGKYSETECFLSYSDGKIKVLIRDSGRPRGRNPGEAGQPDGDYFRNVYALELAAGEIQLATALPGWLSYLNSPETFPDIRDSIEPENFSEHTIKEFLESGYLQDRYNYGVDLKVDLTTYQKVKSGIQTVFGWLCLTERVDAEGIEKLLTGDESVNLNDFENWKYQIIPLHATDYGYGVEVDEGDSLQFTSKENLARVDFSALKAEPFLNDKTVSVKSMVLSWTENTISICHDTNIEFESSGGGS